jgi:DNA polymerase V
MSVHGGRRSGAGRPKGSGQYGESTHSIRIPLSKIKQIKMYLRDECDVAKGLPFFSSKVHAGLPAPVDEIPEERLDLNVHFASTKNETFILIATGDSMIGAGIHDGDLLIVEKKMALSGDIVIALVDGEITVKRFVTSNEGTYLMPENQFYSPICLTPAAAVDFLGVVTHTVHQFT